MILWWKFGNLKTALVTCYYIKKQNNDLQRVSQNPKRIRKKEEKTKTIIYDSFCFCGNHQKLKQCIYLLYDTKKQEKKM